MWAVANRTPVWKLALQLSAERICEIEVAHPEHKQRPRRERRHARAVGGECRVRSGQRRARAECARGGGDEPSRGVREGGVNIIQTTQNCAMHSWGLI